MPKLVRKARNEIEIKTCFHLRRDDPDGHQVLLHGDVYRIKLARARQTPEHLQLAPRLAWVEGARALPLLHSDLQLVTLARANLQLWQQKARKSYYWLQSNMELVLFDLPSGRVVAIVEADTGLLVTT